MPYCNLRQVMPYRLLGMYGISHAGQREWSDVADCGMCRFAGGSGNRPARSSSEPLTARSGVLQRKLGLGDPHLDLDPLSRFVDSGDELFTDLRRWERIRKSVLTESDAKQRERD